MNNNLTGEQIAKFRKAAGLTQEDLGKAVGVSTQAVSRWECGGAPDIALLPAIADKLGVTIDALFGREGGVVQDIDEVVNKWLLSKPQEQRFDQLCRLVWTASRSVMYQRTALEVPINYSKTCIVNTFGEDVLLRMAVDMEEGLIFGVGAEDMSFMTIWPRPEANYAAYFADRDHCRRLFALLSRPGCLELLERIHNDLEPRYYTPGILARQLERPVPEITELLDAMTELHLVRELDLEAETGPVRAYHVHEKWAFTPFMIFTRCLLEKNDAFFLLWDDHQMPDKLGEAESSRCGRLMPATAESPIKQGLQTRGETE